MVPALISVFRFLRFIFKITHIDTRQSRKRVIKLHLLQTTLRGTRLVIFAAIKVLTECRKRPMHEPHFLLLRYRPYNNKQQAPAAGLNCIQDCCFFTIVGSIPSMGCISFKFGQTVVARITASRSHVRAEVSFN